MHLKTEGFRYWQRDYEHWELDLRIKPYLRKDVHAGEFGWLKKAREAKFYSTGLIAQRMGMSRGAYCDLERRELSGSIQLNSLRAAANALDCEIVYAIRSKKKISFAELHWEILYRQALIHPWVQSSPKALKGRALGHVAQQLTKNSTFRRLQNWSKRKLS